MHVVVVEFELLPGAGQRFLPLIEENARISRETEPGCRRFDVCVDPDREDFVFLYEIYDDEAAFQEHSRSAHYESFAAASAGMVQDKAVRIYALRPS